MKKEKKPAKPSKELNVPVLVPKEKRKGEMGKLGNSYQDMLDEIRAKKEARD